MTIREAWLFYRWAFLRWRDCAREILRAYRHWTEQ